MNPVRRRRDLAGARIVVVGATSGIGRAATAQFAALRCRLLLVARDEAELARLTARCRELGAAGVESCVADVGRPDDVERLERVAASAGPITAWINLAAGLDAGDLTGLSTADLERLVATNVLGPLLLSRAALRVLRGQASGTLINLSSLLGVAPNPAHPVYSTSRFAVVGLTMALQRDQRNRHLDICLVLPSSVDSPIFTHAANHSGHELRAIPPAMSPWRVAAAIVRCTRRPRRVVTVGANARAMLIGDRLAPRLTSWMVARWSARLVVRARPAAPSSGNLHEPTPPATVLGGYRQLGWRRAIGDRIGHALPVDER